MDIKSIKKNFCYNTDSERVNDENVGLLPNSAGILVTAGTSSVLSMPESSSTRATRPLGRGIVSKAENNQQWLRTEPGICAMIRIIPFL